MSSMPPRGWAKLRRKGRIGIQILGELARGNPDGLLRVLAERLVPRLERYRNQPWADQSRILLLRGQPGVRAPQLQSEAMLSRARLLVPPHWKPTARELRRLRRTMARRMVRTGAALVTCDDWVPDGRGGWTWREKPLWDGPFDAEVQIGEGPMLVRGSLLEENGSSPRAEGDSAWRALLHRRACGNGGHAHVPLPLLRAPEPPPRAEGSLGRQATEPLVSVLIPTGGYTRTIRGRETVLVRNCLRQLIQRSRYRQFEVVLIDGGECSDQLIGELEALVVEGLGPDRWRFLRDSKPYTYTGRINRAAAAARGDLLLQLNDDTELLDPRGLQVLVEALQGPGVGICGALLLYPDGRVQHAGTAIDNLAPRHAWAGCLPEDLPWGTLQGHRSFHAVTAAVSLCRRALWERLGGFSDRFPVNYGDVDFCLRAGELGQRTVLEPRSRWIHYESASRPTDEVPPELGRFEARWAQRLGGKYSVDDYCSVWRRLLCAPRTD
jgi:GT2 family glycosyltransferase